MPDSSRVTRRFHVDSLVRVPDKRAFFFFCFISFFFQVGEVAEFVAAFLERPAEDFDLLIAFPKKQLSDYSVRAFP